MKSTYIALIASFVFGLFIPVSCGSGDNVFKTSLKTAGKAAGVEVPWPHYLPEGYILDDNIIIENENISILISNKTNKIKTDIFWRPSGTIPYRIDGNKPTIDINGITAQLLVNEENTHIIWNWYPEKYKPGLMIIQLYAPNTVPLSELISIARSINCD